MGSGCPSRWRAVAMIGAKEPLSVTISIDRLGPPVGWTVMVSGAVSVFNGGLV